MICETNSDNLLKYFPDEINSALKKGKILDDREIYEVRLRINRPVMLRGSEKNYFLGVSGEKITNADRALICTENDMEYAFMEVCDNSLYSYENELKEGFITLGGGHRVGICGTAVMSSKGIKSVREIGSMNFRIARQVKGCAEELCFRLFSDAPSGLLVAGAPSSGKTTMLRDLCRLLSEKYVVSVIDERYEIAAVSHGIPQNDVGPMCDIFSGYPKDKALETAVRTMSPDIMLCDEIGNSQDVSAIMTSVNCGVAVIASVHAGNCDELKRKKKIMKLLEQGVFDNIVFMKEKGRVHTVIKTEEFLRKGEKKHEY